MQSARAALRHSLVSGGEAAFVIDSAAVASGVTRRAGSGRGVGAGRRTCASLSIAVSAADPARARAIGSAGERLVHTEEVTGSIPVSPTQLKGRFPVRDRPSLMRVQQPGEHLV